MSVCISVSDKSSPSTAQTSPSSVGSKHGEKMEYSQNHQSNALDCDTSKFERSAELDSPRGHDMQQQPPRWTANQDTSAILSQGKYQQLSTHQHHVQLAVAPHQPGSQEAQRFPSQPADAGQDHSQLNRQSDTAFEGKPETQLRLHITTDVNSIQENVSASESGSTEDTPEVLTFKKRPITPCRSSAPTSAFSSFSSKTYVAKSNTTSPRISSEGSSPETTSFETELDRKRESDRKVNEFLLNLEQKAGFSHRYPPPRSQFQLGQSPVQARGLLDRHRPHTTHNTPRESPTNSYTATATTTTTTNDDTNNIITTNRNLNNTNHNSTKSRILVRTISEIKDSYYRNSGRPDIVSGSSSPESTATPTDKPTPYPYPDDQGSIKSASTITINQMNRAPADNSGAANGPNALRKAASSSPNLTLDCGLVPPKQLHDPKTPMYIPAVLRRTEHTRTVSDVAGCVMRPPRRNHWRPDYERDNCKDCSQRFSLFERRHHCRKCGEIFCGNHVRYRVPLDYNLNFNPAAYVVKACTSCAHAYQDYLGSLKQSVNTNSRSTNRIFTRSPPQIISKADVGRGQEHMEISASIQAGPPISSSVANSVPADWSWSTF